MGSLSNKRHLIVACARRMFTETSVAHIAINNNKQGKEPGKTAQKQFMIALLTEALFYPQNILVVKVFQQVTDTPGLKHYTHTQ